MIDGFANLCRLLLADDSYRVWGRFDHQRGGFGRTEWLIVGGATALLLITMLVSHLRTKRLQKDFWYDSSSRLLHGLSHAHRLDLANRRLMKKLTSARGVENAAELFVEPEYFDTTNLPPALKTSAGELRQLRHRLFE
jgi:hypothetical protein